jgi:membrane protease YdiL (CAAX protease family)
MILEFERAMQSDLLNLLALPTVIILLVYSGIKRQPGLGIVISLAVIAYSVWSHPFGLAWVGFRDPSSWPGMAGMALLLGAAIAFFSTIVLEPVIERVTGRAHDVSVVDSVRGSWHALAQWLLVVWIFVALLEVIFRGYLMGALSDLLGRSILALAVNLLFSSAIFGLAHGYQGPSGILSTGTVGVLIGLIYLLSGSNLWLVVLVHGLIDTIQLALMAANLDKPLSKILIRPRQDAG